MKWKIVPVLGAVCVVLLAGCCRMTDGGVPAVALNRDTKEEKTVTEPSDPKAPSMDKAETEESTQDREAVFCRKSGRPKEPAGWPGCMEEAVRRWMWGLEKAGNVTVLWPEAQMGARQSAEGLSVSDRSGGLSGQTVQEYSGKTGETGSQSAQVWIAETEESDEPSVRGRCRVSEGISGAYSGTFGNIPNREERPGVDCAGRFGPIQKTVSPSDIPPADTVKYTASQKKEITETRYVQSVINPEDPSTYETMVKELEVPIRYVNHAGDIKYAYEDRKWYEYRYCSGTVMLDEKDQDLALRLLNYRGEYNEFEVLHVECQESDDSSQALRYRYQVRYRGKFVMEKAPEELSHLTCVDLGMVAATMTMRREERVPVLVERTFGTGEYRYYGWQERDGKVFYFDENGEKVTGQQVICGVRHTFDEQGARISCAGVEVSQENGSIDWEKAASSRIDTAVVRCAWRASDTGLLMPDVQAEKNLKEAGQAGFETGISLFSQAVTAEEAAEEAEYLIALANKYNITGPVAVTVSWANPEHNGRADVLGREERTKYIAACCQTLQEAGYDPILHTDEAFLSDGLIMEELSDCRLWLTACGPDLTYTGSCEIWQYTDRGTVDGMSGYAGLYISYGK
ncbi:MAG: hypothetical protein HFI15_11245 [Lachnospiraceae bacterium]|nr:hypothetical protein [Lachnospiraceae bacterium]